MRLIKRSSFFKAVKKNAAFSFIELSIVLLIIGILISGVFVGDTLITKSRLQTAKSLTLSSPIANMQSTALWLETALDSSFSSNEAKDGVAISAWNDSKSSAAKVQVTAVGTGPEYSNTINRVHAVKFLGSSENYLEIADAGFLKNTDYTIVVLEKRQSGAANNYFIGSANTAVNGGLALGYRSDSEVIHAQGSNFYSQNALVSSYDDSAGDARTFVFSHSSTEGKKTYINGTLAAEDPTNTAPISDITNLVIGKGYTGEIGEIVILTRAILNSERKDIEDYLEQKWSRKVNRAVATSCVNAVITDGGCDLSAAPCSINQSGIIATVASTSSEATQECNQANYSGSVTYTCIDGVANVTGSCTSVAPCEGVTIAGVSSPVTANSGATGSATCDAANYSGSTISYSCSNGSLSSGTCGCADGYDISSNCSTCTSGYSSVGGSCQSQCSLSAAGIVTATVDASVDDVTKSCDVTGYDTGDSITYNCIAGVATVTGETACDTCASGYSMVGGVCQQQCTLSVAGIISTSVDISASEVTKACDDVGYDTSDFITYTCSGGNVTITGSTACDTCTGSYTLLGGSCQQGCTLSAAGIVTSVVAPAASDTTKSCNATGYNSSDSVTYTCVDGVASITGGTACDACSSGYSLVSGTCQQQCTLSAAGIVTATVAASSTNVTKSCNATGYDSSDSITYTCVDGTATVTGGTSCNTCSSGYNLVSGTCQQDCSITSVTGITSGTTVVSGSTSISCNSGSYTGTINYTCSNGTFTQTGGSCTAPALCTGGTVTTVSGETVHTFTSSGTLSCSIPKTVQILVVGAGGSGGAHTNYNAGTGGGGGGGVVYVSSFSLPAASYTVTVAETTSGRNISSCAGIGNTGANSVFNNSGGTISITAKGGGGGGGCNTGGGSGGGSGGGGHSSGSGGAASAGSVTGVTGVTSYGNNGGSGAATSAGGGGGGASAVGMSKSSGTVGGNGGAGVSISISGSAVVYGSGGGGNGSGTGGSGGANAGSGTAGGATSRSGIDGVNGTGGGGGGNSVSNVESGRGGSGVVIIRYP